MNASEHVPQPPTTWRALTAHLITCTTIPKGMPNFILQAMNTRYLRASTRANLVGGTHGLPLRLSAGHGARHAPLDDQFLQGVSDNACLC